MFDSDSDSEDDDDNLPVIIPEKYPIFLLINGSVANRYAVTFEIETSFDPEKFLLSMVTKINTILKRLTTEGKLHGHSGRAVIIPWEDNEVYSNRASNKNQKGWEHKKLLAFIRQLLYGYGMPKGRQQDKGTPRKYCRINIAWVSPKSMLETTLDTLKDYWNNKKLHEIESFSVSPAPTPAMNPTIAVQFRHSILVNSTNWNDNKGHEDCLEELNTMIRFFLPSHIKVAGLKRFTFASGQNFIRGNPSMLSLECEKTDESIVIREMLQIFRSINRKSQIRDKCTGPWIAVPYFKGTNIQSYRKYLS